MGILIKVLHTAHVNCPDENSIRFLKKIEEQKSLWLKFSFLNDLILEMKTTQTENQRKQILPVNASYNTKAFIVIGQTLKVLFQ